MPPDEPAKGFSAATLDPNCAYLGVITGYVSGERQKHHSQARSPGWPLGVTCIVAISSFFGA